MNIRLLALTITLSIISQLNSSALFKVPGFNESELDLSLGVEHDSRLRLDENGDEIDDVIFNFTAGTGLSKEVGIFNMGLNFQYRYVDHVDHNEYDDDEFYISGDLDTNIDFDYENPNRPRVWISFDNEVYTETDDQTGTLVTRTRRSLISGVAYHINNRTWTDLVIDYGIDSPDEDRGTGEDYSDVDETKGTLRLGYSFNTKWSTFLSYSYTHNETDGLPSYHKQSLSVGVRGQLTPKLYGTVSVGNQWQETPILNLFIVRDEFDEPIGIGTRYELEDQSSMIYSASLDWTLNELTGMTLSANQSYSSSITQSQSVDTNLSIRLSRKINNRLTGFSSLTLRWIDYEDINTESEEERDNYENSDQNIEEIALGLSYDFTRFKMDLSYQWSNHHTDSNIKEDKAEDDYSKSIWALRLHTRF